MERKRKILIVDDSDSMRFLLSEEFLPECDVFCCENGIDALKEFKKNRPDIVITDFKMPLMNGNELTERIKNIQPEMPVIMITATTPLPESRADETLEKSPFFEKLHASIGRLLQAPLFPVLS